MSELSSCFLAVDYYPFHIKLAAALVFFGETCLTERNFWVPSLMGFSKPLILSSGLSWLASEGRVSMSVCMYSLFMKHCVHFLNILPYFASTFYPSVLYTDICRGRKKGGANSPTPMDAQEMGDPDTRPDSRDGRYSFSFSDYFDYFCNQVSISNRLLSPGNRLCSGIFCRV